jgi:hypothetical protein
VMFRMLVLLRAIESAGEGEPQEEQASGSYRARVRCSADITGWTEQHDDARSVKGGYK